MTYKASPAFLLNTHAGCLSREPVSELS